MDRAKEFEAEVEAAFRKHFGDSARGAAATVLWATMDSGSPDDLGSGDMEVTETGMPLLEIWRTAPTEDHGSFDIRIDPRD